MARAGGRGGDDPAQEDQGAEGAQADHGLRDRPSGVLQPFAEAGQPAPDPRRDGSRGTAEGAGDFVQAQLVEVAEREGLAELGWELGQEGPHVADLLAEGRLGSGSPGGVALGAGHGALSRVPASA